MKCVVAALLALAGVLAVSCSDQPLVDPDWRVRKDPWPKAVVDAAARIPVQRGGRIKPFASFAGFEMLRLHGKRSLKTPWGEKLKPTEWMLDCLFFPEQARHYEIVIIDDSRVAESVGVDVSRKERRAQYSMAELQDSTQEIGRQGEAFKKKLTDSRTTVESQIINLAERLPALSFALQAFDFARDDYVTAELPGFAEAFPGRERVGFLDVASKFHGLRDKLDKAGKEHAPAVEKLYRSLSSGAYYSRYVSFLSPADPQDETYLSPADVLTPMLQMGTIDTVQLPVLRRIEKLSAVKGDLAEFTTEFVEFSKELVSRAEKRAEFEKIDLEVGFFRSDWFTRGLVFFLLGFVACAALWIGPRLKAVYLLTWGSVLTGAAMMIIGVVIRCMIRGRPPITTPYELILSATAVGVLVMLFVEWTRRTVLPLSISAAFGALGVLLSYWHEGIAGTDTMTPLVAVLDTNFWLTVHVIVVSMGYLAGTLAAVIANVYIFGKLFRYRYQDAKFYSDLGRIIYGVLCFGLLFSTVGTILGGVWANDSWGRFWGWDPKENGALLLVLGYLAVMHARLGGYVREFGLALCSIAIGIIVVWAFFGVNLIGIGLHSYGFDEKMVFATNAYYGVQGGVLALGIVTWYIQRRTKL